MGHLDDAQRTVVSYLYGIEGYPMLGLDETAAHLALPRAKAARLDHLELSRCGMRWSAPGNLFACAA